MRLRFKTELNLNFFENMDRPEFSIFIYIKLQIFGLSEEVKQLEEERDRFVHTIDFAAQQQTELESMVVELEKSLGLNDWMDMEPVTLPDPTMATQADAQRQAMYVVHLPFLYHVIISL